MSQFARVVRQAVDTLPPEIKRHLDNVVIDVEDEPSVEFLRHSGFTDQEIDEGADLLGIFIPTNGLILEEDVDQSNPERLIIFKNPHEDAFEDPGRLLIEIRKTVIHEIAHHFGWSDRDLEQFDDNPDPFSR